MPKAVGRPTLKPKRVTLSLAAHHAAELERLAQAHDVKLSTFCANLLERYSLEEQGTLASDILKTAVVETVQKEMAEHHHRVRSLLARTALESIATRQLARLNLKAQLQSGAVDKYNEQAWEYAVHVLKNPTPAIRAAIAQLSESISNDDPALLMQVRDSMTSSGEEVQQLKAQVQQLTDQQTQLMQMMGQMQQLFSSLNQRISDTQRVNLEAIEKLEQAEQDARNKKGWLR